MKLWGKKFDELFTLQINTLKMLMQLIMSGHMQPN